MKIARHKQLSQWKHMGLMKFSQAKKLIPPKEGVHFDTTVGKWKILKSISRWCKWAKLQADRGNPEKKWWKKKRLGRQQRERLKRKSGYKPKNASATRQSTGNPKQQNQNKPPTGSRRQSTQYHQPNWGRNSFYFGDDERPNHYGHHAH